MLNQEINPNDYSFLSGGGEMGRLMRRKDWSQTAIGSPGSWPQSLRTTLSIILNSRFPMFLFWGEYHTFFYNDAYRPSLGQDGKHPHALGMPGAEVWPEIWTDIYPLIQQVLKGNGATWAEDQLLPIFRNGKLEDVYWTFSYSPVTDEKEIIAGVFVTCTETTEKIANYKKVEESRNQLQFAIEAAELGTWDYNPVSNKFTANNRLKDWFGLPHQPEINLDHAIELIAEKDRPRVVAAIKKALDYNSGGQYDIEYSVDNPFSGKTLILDVKGKASFNDEKIAVRFNGTMQDVTERVMARRKIEESEERFRSMAESSDILISISDETGNAVFFNKAWARLTGRRVEDFLKFGWTDLIHPDDKDFVDIFLDSFKRRKPWAEKFRVLNRENQYSWIFGQGQPRFTADGLFTGFIGSCIDYTLQQEALQKVEDSEYKFRTLIEETSIATGLYVGRELRIQYMNEEMSGFFGKTKNITGMPLAEAVPELVGQPFLKLLDDVYSTGTPYTGKEEVARLEINGSLQTFYFDFTYKALRNKDGSIFGIHHIAVDVTKRVLANQALQRSKEKFRHTVEQAPVGITILRGREYFVEMANAAYLQIVKQTSGDLVGKKLFDAMPQVKDPIQHILDEVFNTGIPYHGVEFPIYIGEKDELLSYFNFVYQPLRETDGQINGVIVVATDVTASVQAKRKLAESENEFRNMVMQSPIAMTILRGKDHIIETANQVLIDNIWRKQREEVIGKSILDVFPELKDQKYAGLLNTVYETGVLHQEKESVAWVLGDDGMRKFYLDFEYRPLYDPSNLIAGIIITVNDVTEKVVARLKTEESEQRLNLVIDATELGTWELNIQTDEMKYSDRFVQMFGIEDTGHITHKQLLNRLHPDDMPTRNEAFARSFETGILNYESRIVWSNGLQRWIEIKGKVFMDDKGAPSLIIGTARDTTDEKYYQHELEDRERKFRLLADSMPQMVWTGNAYGELNYFNQSVYTYSGLSKEEIAEKGWFGMIHPDDEAENLKAWNHAIETGTDFIFEHRFRREDGQYRWQLSRAIPQRDAIDNIRMWVGTSTDIQEIKELDEQKDLFIGIASHELKTPITTIKGYLQLFQEIYSETKDDFLKHSVDRMHKQINILTDLISDLLDLSKIKSGSLHFNKENFNIAELTNEIIDSTKDVNPNHTIQLTACDTAMVHGDRNRIGQVVNNFLTNAIKYSPDSKIIKVAVIAVDERVMISVKDEGIGIAKNDQEKIFERFYRVEGKNEKTFPGFGIGLFISAEIISKHEGEIGVSSETGEGATFYFSLPLLK